jgi:large subunit ribosomal protein L10e
LYGQDGSILLKPDWEIDLDGWFVPPRGFTKFKREEYLKLRSEGRIVADGVNAKVATLHRSTFWYTQLHYVDIFFLCNSFSLHVQLLTWHGSLEGRQRGKGVFPPSVAGSA